MRKIALLHLLIVMLLPSMAGAQDTADDSDWEAMCLEMSQLCPAEYGDGWTIKSVTMDADTVYIDMVVPGQLKGFMSTLTGDGANVKRLWMNQIAAFDKRWLTLANSLSRDDRFLILMLRPGDDDKASRIVIGPADLTK